MAGPGPDYERFPPLSGSTGGGSIRPPSALAERVCSGRVRPGGRLAVVRSCRFGDSVDDPALDRIYRSSLARGEASGYAGHRGGPLRPTDQHENSRDARVDYPEIDFVAG